MWKNYVNLQIIQNKAMIYVLPFVLKVLLQECIYKC